jgi:hypothetical protein
VKVRVSCIAPSTPPHFGSYGGPDEGAQDRLLVDQPGELTEALLSVDAKGKATNLGPPRVPAWAGLMGAKLAPEQTAHLFVSANALFLREDDHWPTVFYAVARRRGLALRWRGE